MHGRLSCDPDCLAIVANRKRAIPSRHWIRVTAPQAARRLIAAEENLANW